MPRVPKRIPKKIDDTIFTASLEVRFLLSIPDHDLLGHLLKVLQPKYPKFQPANQVIPVQFRALDPQLKYLPDYQFSNEEFSIGISKQSILFEYPDAYQGWDHFYAQVKSVLDELDSYNIFQHTERVGLRYINVLENVKDLEEVLDLKLNIHFEDFVEKNIAFRNELFLDDTVVILNVFQNGFATKNNKQKQGFIIDIDVSTTNQIPKVGSQLLPLITDLHKKEKYVFFNILTQKFIDSKNPVY